MWLLETASSRSYNCCGETCFTGNNGFLMRLCILMLECTGDLGDQFGAKLSLCRFQKISDLEANNIRRCDVTPKIYENNQIDDICKQYNKAHKNIIDILFFFFFEFQQLEINARKYLGDFIVFISECRLYVTFSFLQEMWRYNSGWRDGILLKCNNMRHRGR